MTETAEPGENLEALRSTLREGQRLSQQGSYQRRAPASAAIPHLLRARAGLKVYIAEHPEDEDAWRLLSAAEECLLNYRDAVRCLERATALSGSDRKDRKRLALLGQYEGEWAELPLAPQQLEVLGEHLSRRLAEEGCDHTLRLTRAWLTAIGVQQPKRVEDALRNRGGYCDCEVLANVVEG